MKVISFGRASSNDVVINDPMVSSNFHMKLVVSDDGKVKVVDCNSTNGTFINDCRTAKAELNVGDTIFVMGLKIVFGKNIVI